jgi:hypothetical protein
MATSRWQRTALIVSQRYHRGGTYQTRNPLAVHSPLRSVPLLRPAATVFGTAWYDGTWNQPKPAAAAVDVLPPMPADAQHELRNAIAGLAEAQRVYDAARAEIGDANRTGREALVVAGRVVASAVRFTPERIRERKSYAFRLFNKRRGQLAAARRRLTAARAALGLPVEATALAPVATASRAARPLTHQAGLRAAA